MTRILIIDGAARVWQDELVAFGGLTNREMFERALRLHDPDVECVTLNVADGEGFRPGLSVADFDGAVITGSPLNVYNAVPEVARQIAFVRSVFGAGVPVYGSCWGLQLATVVLGGSVRLNPRGREIGIARNIVRTEAGRSHPLFGDKPSVFDALCSHLDEVETLPPEASVLAGNRVSDVQAMAVETPAASFTGVQYHPEHTFAVTASIIDARRAELSAEGFASSPEALDPIVADLRALEADPGRRDISWRHGLEPHVLDPKLRTAEIGYWLRAKAEPRRARRLAAA